jgi:hypothetical protein
VSEQADRAESWLLKAEDSRTDSELRQGYATLAVGWALLAVLNELRKFDVVAVEDDRT